MKYPVLPEHRFDEAAMREYCKARGATLLRVLQQMKPARLAAAGVMLALDADGIVKVFKEELPHGDLGARPDESESALHAEADGLPFLPRLYGTETWNGIRILRQSVSYGRSLHDWYQVKLPASALRPLIGRLALMLHALHGRSVVHLDVWERNVIVDGDRLSLIDLGDGRRITEELRPFSQFLPRPQTDVRALVALAYQMMRIGEDPVFERLVTQLHADSGSLTMLQLAEEMGTETVPLPPLEAVPRTLRGVGRVLFPARMGIPHRGHIDFMARVMELGYPLVISLQCAYTVSVIDPLQKWLVMKMVAASLQARGFVPGEDFTFVHTPLFDTDERHRMHFALMPGFQDVVAVASGNPDVHAMFGRTLPIIDQKAVFGTEGEPYEVRSWGEELRAAVRNGDVAAFRALAAEGVEGVLPFEQLRELCSQVEGPPLRAKGVTVTVRDAEGEKLAEGRALPYLSPQEAAVRWLRDMGREVEVVDLYATDTVLTVDGVQRTLCDASASYGEEGALRITFVLV